MPLEPWREAVCESAHGLATDDPAGFADALEQVAADIRALPPPTGREDDVERFAGLLSDQADRFAEAAPRLDETLRRWRAIADRLDPEGELPRTANETLAAGVDPEAMLRVLADPEARATMEELSEQWRALYSSDEARELERAADSLGVDERCAVDPAPPRSSSDR